MELFVQRVCKSYRGTAVLKDFSLTAKTGITCLMAPSGAGKTTLLRILLGLERAESGSVRTVPAACRWAAVFQEDRLLEQLDAAGNLRFALGRDYDAARAAALLSRLGLSLEDPKPVREYSGGMKRRLALSRALLAPAQALALDEPFTGMDEENRLRALECIRRAGGERMILLVTHEPEDARFLGAAIVRLP